MMACMTNMVWDKDYGLPGESDLVCIFCESWVSGHACYTCNEYKGVVSLEEFERVMGYPFED